MTHFYNEFDPKAAAWLRELIAQGHLPPGVVDERSIEEIEPQELQRYVQCHFFAGIGGWPLALQLAGWPHDRPVWTGSCPCQPFSAAGKGDGFADERHLWPAFHWLIQQCRPAVVLGEQVASAAVGPWVDLVLTDLEALDYAVGAYAGPAAGIGAPHLRDRTFWVGYTDGERARRDGGAVHKAVTGQDRQHGADDAVASSAAVWGANADDRGAGPLNGHWRTADWLGCRDGKWRPVEASPQSLVDGLPDGLGRVRDSCLVEIEEGVTEYAKARETDAAEELRNLCLALGEEAQRLGPVGGFGNIQAPQVLLAFVCQLAAQGWAVAQGLPLRRQEGARSDLRMLWDSEAAARTSRGRGLEEQRVRKLADALHFLSPVLARHAQEAWGQAAEAHAEIGFPLGKGHAARVGRLRGYGNAIVPQQAEQFIGAVMEIIA
ncbi:DNA cytosine methyltransferase [Xanthomonas translucens]|uniref:DNA cytosine methyltransferase n=1 Tax=Xanthomonas campestris pv. translucens TaxID=343 RepID=UPI0009BE0BA3|nr:DNA cytosine methyltransferase [Xanthomonas translucens]